MSVTTYAGIVRNGKVEPTTITQAVAQRKANAWLIGYVGNLLRADRGTLVRPGTEWVWRFEVFITSLAHEPWGPIGTVDVDAATGAITAAEQTQALLYERGRTYPRPV